MEEILEIHVDETDDLEIINSPVSEREQSPRKSSPLQTSTPDSSKTLTTVLSDSVTEESRVTLEEVIMSRPKLIVTSSARRAGNQSENLSLSEIITSKRQSQKQEEKEVFRVNRKRNIGKTSEKKRLVTKVGPSPFNGPPSTYSADVSFPVASVRPTPLYWKVGCVSNKNSAALNSSSSNSRKRDLHHVDDADAEDSETLSPKRHAGN